MSPVAPGGESNAAQHMSDKVVFFRTPAHLRRWFAKHHGTASELWVGFYRRDSGHRSITWAESVDEALCVGWIDGIRKRIDDVSYKIRFTPRRRGSVWSAINIARVAVLEKEGRMTRRGLEAFAARRENKSGIYSYEQRSATLPEPYNSRLQDDPRAAAFFAAQPPSYRKLIFWWIASAKKEETRTSRFHKLATACRAGKRL
jgi:uncharacterized protein YdeI (YjbR/CyaY-like superfamily)